jgi:hypothetical protein
MLRDLFPRTHGHYEGSRFAGDLEAFAKWLRAVGYSRPSAHRHVYRLNRVQFETHRFRVRSSPTGRRWKTGTTGFKLDAV